MIISKHIIKFFSLFILFGFVANAQQEKQIQKVGFVDMEYVLSKIPSYEEAQAKLDSETTTWKGNLDKMYLKLATMEKEFLNEKPLLTQDLIKERELEIKEHKDEITRTENTYFGTEGKLFELRKELVQPYQNLVFNAVQTIAKLRKYDIIFEKSSQITVLYTNKKYDISNLVLKYIQKSEKEIEKEEAAIKKEIARKARQKRIEEQKKKREADRSAREKKREADRLALEKKKEEDQLAREEKINLEKLAREEARKAKREADNISEETAIDSLAQ